MKKYFKFRKDFRCNWHGILGAYDTTNLVEQIVEYDFPFKQKHKWHRTNFATKDYYADVFVFESDGETQKYVNELNKTLNGLAYFIKREDEYDTIEELCDYWIVWAEDVGYQQPFVIVKGVSSMDFEYISRRYRLHEGGYERVYGAIETDKGLIYVAKMNEKGELELL